MALPVKNILLNSTAILLMHIAAGCGTREESQSVPVAEVAIVPEATTRGRYLAYKEAASDQFAPAPVAASRPQSRMVIKTASLNVEISNYEEALAQIQKIAAQYGGYLISSTTQTLASNVKSGNVTIRIDARNFETALQELKKLAQKVEQESVQGSDVTEEFYDLTARLENKRKAEKRYQEILASAKTTKDILEVEQALTNVREEIERLEGRKRYLEDQIALSTITINLHEPYPLMASGQYGFLAKMRRGIENGVSGFSDVLSACLTFAIAGIPVFVLLFVLIWAVKRYRRKARTTPPAKATMAEKKE
jgi:hypothetical protein